MDEIYKELASLCKKGLMYHSYGNFEGFKDYEDVSLKDLREISYLSRLLVENKEREMSNYED